MGGKSRKSGGVSKKLIDQLKGLKGLPTCGSTKGKKADAKNKNPNKGILNLLDQ